MNEIFRRVSVRRFQDRPVGGEKQNCCFVLPWRLHLPETNSPGNFMSLPTECGWENWLPAVPMPAA